MCKCASEDIVVDLIHCNPSSQPSSRPSSNPTYSRDQNKTHIEKYNNYVVIRLGCYSTKLWSPSTVPRIPKLDPVPKRDPVPKVQFVKDINGNISTHIPTYIRGLSYEILPIYYRIDKSINTNLDMKYYIVWGFDIDKQYNTILKSL